MTEDEKPSLRPARRRAKRPDPRKLASSEFAAVPVKPRHDGWTPDRQLGFLRALAATGSVSDAARAVRRSVRGAYRLRARPEAESFRLAWDRALDVAVARLSDAAFSRALHGEAVPHYFQGKKVGEHRRFDNRLLAFLLRHRDFARYGRAVAGIERAMDADLPMTRLAEELARLEQQDEGAGKAAPTPDSEARRQEPQPPLAGVVMRGAPKGRQAIREEIYAELERYGIQIPGRPRPVKQWADEEAHWLAVEAASNAVGGLDDDAEWDDDDMLFDDEQDDDALFHEEDEEGGEEDYSPAPGEDPHDWRNWRSNADDDA